MKKRPSCKILLLPFPLLFLWACVGSAHDGGMGACSGLDWEDAVDDSHGLRIRTNFVLAYPECADAIAQSRGLKNVRIRTLQEFERELRVHRANAGLSTAESQPKIQILR
jgi:hypothetical protein